MTERQQLSDATCTALQLANFWQDVSRDLEKGRIYIPLDALQKHGLTFEDVEARRFSENYGALMRDLIQRTRALFAQGYPLAATLSTPTCVWTSKCSAEAEWPFSMPSTPSATTRSSIARPSAKASRCACSAVRSSAASARFYPRQAQGMTNHLHLTAPRMQPRGSRDCAPFHWMSPHPTRSAAPSPAIPPAISITPFIFCPSPSASLSALSTPSCVWSTTPPMQPGNVASKQRGLARWRALLDRCLCRRRLRPPNSSRLRRYLLAASRSLRAISMT